MKVEFRESLYKDLRSIREKHILDAVRETVESIEHATTPDDITHLKKLTGPKNYFRVRIGDFRLGLRIENDTVIVLRFLHRKEVYRYFP